MQKIHNFKHKLHWNQASAVAAECIFNVAVTLSATGNPVLDQFRQTDTMRFN